MSESSCTCGSTPAATAATAVEDPEFRAAVDEITRTAVTAAVAALSSQNAALIERIEFLEARPIVAAAEPDPVDPDDEDPDGVAEDITAAATPNDPLEALSSRVGNIEDLLAQLIAAQIGNVQDLPAPAA